jgi:hypothetical protein
VIGSRVKAKEGWTECYVPSRMGGRLKDQKYVPSLESNRLYARQVGLVECASLSSSVACEMA